MKLEPISVSLLPNTENDDLRLALGLLLRPWTWLKGRATTRLEEEFEYFYPGYLASAFLSGRTALSEVLRALGVKNGDEVVVPSFSCVVVANAVLSLKAKPVFADIQKETFNITLRTLQKAVTKKTRAIVVQHTFGYPAPIEEVVAWANSRGIKVVEDCAHGLKIPYSGGWLGGFGDGAIFSFGRDKALSSVFGGLGLVKSKFGQNLKSAQKKLDLPTAGFVFRQLFYLFYFRASLSVYNFCSVGKGLIWAGQQVGLLTKAVLSGEREGRSAKLLAARLPNALASLALYQLKKIDRFNLHRSNCVIRYAYALQGLPAKLPFWKTPQNFPYPLLRFTLLTNRAQELYETAKKKGVLLNNWYHPPIAPVGVDYEAIGYE
ncbi:DegT/DnrJ/EryC1/StrS family aminotransferase, partial [Patescibacteria group bacterium]|nr:DegT/DnrJ/EryC1/StrS family aminotransferase [Patescibacteria group bacterium]